MRICTEKDYAAMSRKAAEIFAAEVAACPTGAFGFATGGTPKGMYEILTENRVNLSTITAFNLDEYFPISAGNPQSYAVYMAQKLFDACGVPKESRHMPNGEAAEAAAECKAYDAKLAATGGLAMQILGLGGNGHIAFNEPGEEFSRGTHLVELAEATVRANARFFPCETEVPRHALTMGIRDIMHSRKILLLVSGGGKAEILARSLNGPITPAVPASVLQLHPHVTVVCDEAAGRLLRG